MAASGGINTAQAFAPSRLRVNTAPLGTTLPTDATTALTSTFFDYGSIAEDGLNFNEDRTTNQVFDYEGNLVREVVVRRVYTITGTLLQQSSQVNQMVNGGGVTTVVGGLATFVPPSGRVNTPYAVVLEWVDGTTSARYLIPKATSATGASRPFGPGVTATPFTLTITATTGVAPWSFLSNDVVNFPALP